MAHLDGGIWDVDDGTVVHRWPWIRPEPENIFEHGRDVPQQPFIDSERSRQVGHDDDVPVLEPEIGISLCRSSSSMR